ncbi:hypothetical protein JNW90_01445 [Micromonospora sp. STR1s_5]|nr:hypothetical protein [Micromonospora sp. STR1s_5]
MSVAAVDVVALAVDVLKTSVVVGEKFGGPEHVSGLNEPPFPHLRVISLPGGDDGRLLWTVRRELQVEAWGHPDGRPGKAALHRLLYDAVIVLARLADDDHVPGRPVVVDAYTVGTARWAPDRASGQPCWAHRLLIVAHPDNTPG